MIKSFSSNDTQAKSQLYFKPTQKTEEDEYVDTLKQTSQALTADSQMSHVPAQALEKYKKRIKLRVSQNFPMDFFENHMDDSPDEKKAHHFKSVPVKVIRSPEIRQTKNVATENPRNANETPNFKPQNFMSTGGNNNEEKVASSRNQIFHEGQTMRDSVFEVGNLIQTRSRSTERGSMMGTGLNTLRMRPQPLNTRTKFEELGHNYSNFPLITLENDVKSASHPRRVALHTPRRENITSFRRPRQVTFNLYNEEKPAENTSTSDSNHMVIANSYYYRRGISCHPEINDSKQVENEYQSLQALRKEPLKLKKSASRDSFHRESDLLRVSRTNRAYFQSVNREQVSLPLVWKVAKTEETENSRLTSEREFENHFANEQQGSDRKKIAPSKALVNFHKTIMKSFGANNQENSITSQNMNSIRKVNGALEQDQSRESRLDMIARSIGRKRSEQKWINGRSEAQQKEGMDFSFSKEYNKGEKNEETSLKSPTKEIREKTPSPDRHEISDFKITGSRNQTRIKKKFVLLKREEP